jgi:flagellar biosynthetic protein FliR
MNSLTSIAAIAVLIVRPGMLIVATPLLGALQTPPIMRVGLTLILALVMAPIVAVPADLTTTGLVVVILREMAIGLSLALAIRVLVGGAEFAGHYAGYQIGLSMGSLIDPQTGVRNNILAILYSQLAIVMLLATNAHHGLLRALADSYAALPIGAGGIGPALGTQVARMLGLVFVLGIRLAVPVVIVLVLVELALGLVSRLAPALNVMIAGAPIRMLVGLLVLAAALGTLPSLLARYLPSAFDLAAETAQSFR